VNRKKIIIAVDGYSSCGKSTFAKAIAKKVNYLYIDSGAMYRAVTLACIRQGIANDDGVKEELVSQLLNKINVGFIPDKNAEGWLTTLNGEVVEADIRSLRVSNLVSPVSALPIVRKKMTQQQQKMGEQQGIVMDGRDIGTVVFPNAQLKIFMTAEPKIRAQRRLNELKQNGQDVSFEQILKNIEERDYIDRNRSVAPLTQADDAIVLDNSSMTVEEQMDWFTQIYKKITEG